MSRLYNAAKGVAKAVRATPALVVGSLAINATTQYYAQKAKKIKEGGISNKKTKAQIAKNKKIVEKRKYAAALKKKKDQLDKEVGARREKKLKSRSI